MTHIPPTPATEGDTTDNTESRKGIAALVVFLASLVVTLVHPNENTAMLTFGLGLILWSSIITPTSGNDRPGMLH